MAEARQVVKDMNLWRVRHDVTDGVARLGSLDFLSTSPSHGNAAPLGLFGDEKPSIRRVTGTGEVEDSRVTMPAKCHLVIANPPYTRAGGPGDEKNTRWNPIFGSLLDKRDAERMKKALRKALDGTAASLYAGLGSAFVVLADEALDFGGRMAFVLPATMLAGLTSRCTTRSFIDAKAVATSRRIGVAWTSGTGPPASDRRSAKDLSACGMTMIQWASESPLSTTGTTFWTPDSPGNRSSRSAPGSLGMNLATWGPTPSDSTTWTRPKPPDPTCSPTTHCRRRRRRTCGGWESSGSGNGTCQDDSRRVKEPEE